MPVPEVLFRALTSGAGLEAASGLRGNLRALRAAQGPLAGPAWDADCEEANRDSGATSGLIRHALADGSWMIQLACAQGAYQGSSWAVQLWSPASGPAVAAVLCWPVPAERADSAAPGVELSDQVVVWGDLNATVPAAGQRAGAEIVNRFRAIGDCGTRSRYLLVRGTTGLVDLAATLTCPDTPAAVPRGPADWPHLPFPHR